MVQSTKLRNEIKNMKHQAISKFGLLKILPPALLGVLAGLFASSNLLDSGSRKDLTTLSQKQSTSLRISPALPAENAISVLSPDLNRSSAVMWYGEERNILNLKLINIESSADEKLEVWVHPENSQDTRLGNIINFASFHTPHKFESGTKVSVRLDTETPEAQGPWVLIGYTP